MVCRGSLVRMKMTPERERQRWIDSVLQDRDCGQEGYRLGMTKGLGVHVYPSDEAGETRWVVTTPDGFWMDALPTKEQALHLCDVMEWMVLEIYILGFSVDLGV